MTIGERFCACALNFLVSHDAVKEIIIGKEGRIKFKVLISSFFKSDLDLKKFLASDSNFESLETFYIDSSGSLLVRKHLLVFVKFLNSINENDYNEKLLLYNHLHFSVQKINDMLEWTFHVSFLHDVVLGDFLSNEEKSDVESKSST